MNIYHAVIFLFEGSSLVEFRLSFFNDLYA